MIGRAQLAVSRCLLLGLAVLLLGHAQAQAQPSASEQLVKATFLYRFASFVTWPAGTFASADSPILICVVGADPFGRSLDAVVQDQRVDGRAFAVRRLRAFSGNEGCRIVYIGSGAQTVEQALRVARDRPVLTVTDAHDRPRTRGVIHFVVLDNRVRFHIDEALAAHSGLVISPRLLALAVSVRRRAAT